MLVGIDKLKLTHDGNLVSIRYEKEEVRLELVSVAGDKISVLLSGIYLFAAQNFLEGSIIYDTRTVASASITKDDIVYAIKLENKGRDIGKVSQDISSKKLSLFLLEPSYGVEIACVCQKVHAM